MSKAKKFFNDRGISLSAKKYFVDAFSAMAMGLFASLLIGTIFKTVATHTGIEFFMKIPRCVEFCFRFCW